MPRKLKRTYSAAASRAKRVAAVSKSGKVSRWKGITAKRVLAMDAQLRATRSMYSTATDAIFDMKEEKYFNTSADLETYPQEPTEGPKKVSVLAFATTSNLVPGTTTGAVEQYCGHNIQDLHMLRPFHSSAAANLLPYMIDGKHVFPSANSVSWQINRNYAIVGPTYAPNSDLVKINNIENLLAVRCRIVRVTPKLAPGITTAINPTADLFVDQHGQPYSPADSQFSYSDAEFAAVNRRKYTVLQDNKFTLTNPLVQFSEASLPGTSRFTQIPVMQPQGSHTKKMVTRHQLTAKKGEKVRYDNPAAEVCSTTGHRREYVFMHFWYENSDGGLSGANPPAIGTTGVVPDAEAVKVHYRVESRFKEA